VNDSGCGRACAGDLKRNLKQIRRNVLRRKNIYLLSLRHRRSVRDKHGDSAFGESIVKKTIAKL